MFLSSNKTFLCVRASAGDFKKSSFSFINGFSNSSVIFSCLWCSGIQFRGSSCSSSSWCKFPTLCLHCSPFLQRLQHDPLGDVGVWLKFTMTNGVTVFGFLSLRSTVMGYVHMLGFVLSQSSSRMTSTLTSSVVLM